MCITVGIYACHVGIFRYVKAATTFLASVIARSNCAFYGQHSQNGKRIEMCVRMCVRMCVCQIRGIQQCCRQMWLAYNFYS